MSKINTKIIKYLENDAIAEWSVSNLLGAYNTGFYGKITIQFEAGKIVLLRKEETKKPPKTLLPDGVKNGGFRNGNK